MIKVSASHRSRLANAPRFSAVAQTFGVGRCQRIATGGVLCGKREEEWTGPRRRRFLSSGRRFFQYHMCVGPCEPERADSRDESAAGIWPLSGFSLNEDWG